MLRRSKIFIAAPVEIANSSGGAKSNCFPRVPLFIVSLIPNYVPVRFAGAKEIQVNMLAGTPHGYAAPRELTATWKSATINISLLRSMGPLRLFLSIVRRTISARSRPCRL
jgi:hypothetical protein